MSQAINPKLRAAAEQLTRELFDKGKIIEGGWQGLRLMAVPPDAPDIQLREMRMAFFAGAHHLMQSIMNVLEPGNEITETDLNRMAMIQKELDEFEKTFIVEQVPTKGRA